MQNNEHIILFDGVCNLCNSSVQFVIKHDKHQKFKFAALQSESGQSLLKQFELPQDDFKSFVYIQHNKCLLRSSGALAVTKELGRGWQLLYIFTIVPKFIRDFVYNRIAKSRYSLFGRRDYCMVPTPELRQRFLV